MQYKSKIRRDGEIPYIVKYRNIKYPRLEFRTGELVLVLPHNGHNPEEIIKKHRKWIEGKLKFISDHIGRSSKLKLKQRSVEELRSAVSEFVEEHAEMLCVNVNRIYIRKMKSKWASCSVRKNITINSLMRYLPDSLIRYIVYHEMAHIIERKHTRRFWRAIEREYKNYSEYEKDLFFYWFRLNRLPR